MMTHTIDTRQGLPDGMHNLLGDYPREAWPDHPNFARSIRNWMGAHSMFRQLSQITKDDTETFLNRSMSDQDYAHRLRHFGHLLVGNLHGHHTWEDRQFFPELEAADPAFARGLAMLESDHEALDDLLDRFSRTGNRVVQLAQLQPDQMCEQAGALHGVADQLGRFLERHLTDEEHLVVPLLLHHKLRG